MTAIPQSFHSCVAVCPVTTLAIKRALSDFFFPFKAIHCVCFVSYRVPAAAAPSAVGRVCRYSQAAAAAEVKVREQSHNLKILPALPRLSLCHCRCASPVSSLSSTLFSSLFCVLYPLPSLCCPPLSVCTHIVLPLCGPCTTNSFQRGFTHEYKRQQ